MGKIYHISKRKEDGKWQVKAEKSEKAVKLFWTKEEAVKYAKELAERNDASTAFHASKGKNKGKLQKH